MYRSNWKAFCQELCVTGVKYGIMKIGSEKENLHWIYTIDKPPLLLLLLRPSAGRVFLPPVSCVETFSMKFFSFASTHLFLIHFKVNLRALSRVSSSSCSSKEKNTVMHTIISLDYNNFSIFLKMWTRQNWTPNSVVFLWHYSSSFISPRFQSPLVYLTVIFSGAWTLRKYDSHLMWVLVFLDRIECRTPK